MAGCSSSSSSSAPRPLHGRRPAGAGSGVGARPAPARPPERREHPVRLAGAGVDLPRLEQQRGVAALGENPVVTESASDRAVTLDRVRLVAAIPVARRPPRSRSISSRLSLLRRLRRMTRRDPWRRRSRIERRGASGAATSARRRPAPSPPSSSGAQTSTGMTGPPRHGRGQQRRVVREPQVLPEPDDRGHAARVAFAP